MAPVLVDSIFETIVDLNKSGTTILLVEQNAAWLCRSITGAT
jgi:ABC-type branched-subunit amino acid transport system ATPase component